MIIRLFLALLVLNMVAFVVRAEAAERPFVAADQFPETLYELQDRMSGDFGRHDAKQLTTLGSRLLSWRFGSGKDNGRHYASDAAIADHGIALLDQGACLNLKWKF